MTAWSAIVLAGRRPGVDPLARAFGRSFKAEIPILGRPMLAWVIEALLASPAIGRVLILTQETDSLGSGEDAGLLADERVSIQPSGAGISRSIAAAAGTAAAPWPVLITTADHPLLTPAIVASFIAGSEDADLAVGAVERSTLLAAYPDSRRTWLRFRDGAYSGRTCLRCADRVPAPRSRSGPAPSRIASRR